jgi:dipeptidyl aminopeptidase/acylaminoacyl peptidase
MRRRIAPALLLACLPFALAAGAPEELPVATPALPPPPELTLERIMADPDWLGNAPEDPYWADDGRSIYYFQKRPGEEVRDLVEIDREGEAMRLFGVGERGGADAPGGHLSPDRRRKVYAREGDVFVKDVATGEVRQLTRTAVAEGSPRFLADGRRVSFRRGDEVLVRDLETGLEAQAAELRLTQDPEAKRKEEAEKADYLRRQQERLLAIIRQGIGRREAERERELAERRADPTRLKPPFYLGEEVEIRQLSLSPSGEWLLVVLGKREENRGKPDLLPNFVTESGYVETREARSKVGTGEPASERLVLLDLAHHGQHELDLALLPGIFDDPLADLRRRAEASRKAAEAGDLALEEEDLEPEEVPVAQAAEAAEEVAAALTAEVEGGQEEEAPAAAEGSKPQSEEKPQPRAVEIGPLVWSDDGRRVAVVAFSRDNKDRWIATVDFEARALVPVHRLHDGAWVTHEFNEVGWLPDGDRLFYLSEESGFSQLHLADLAAAPPEPAPPVEPAAPPEPAPAPEAAAEEPPPAAPPAPAEHPLGAAAPHFGQPFAGRHRRLTEGRFLVSEVVASRDGAFLYFTANAEHPGIYETHRVVLATGEVQVVTSLGGLNDYLLSPDDGSLLVVHSAAAQPPELYLQAAEPGAPARRLTRTVSADFAAIAWSAPLYVEVPSTRAPRPIPARLYLPEAGSDPGVGRRPAVVFVHGAGYLQNAHLGWSSYFREFMFHTFLARRGHAVLDLDYRASAGYGRDWRTAIYRQMGTPELEDLADAVEWLVAEQGVDRRRIGLYGGSYGGFLTLMALFQRPALFAAGAALRPVTDWAHYNHGYTSNILNTPALDPEAYERSSPIEFADGLERPLLICAPMQDDNVFFQDTVRLAQRLIELGKEDWEVAIYPVEPHAFREPSSWLDEYRRIAKLFERCLR